MTTLTFESPEYESIAPSTPFERLLLARMEALEAKVGELQTLATSQAETIVAQAEQIANFNDRLSRTQGTVVGLEIAQDELEERFVKAIPSTTPPGSVSAKTEGHIQHVKALLLHEQNHRLTVKFLGSRLGVSKRQAWNIVHRMEAEGVVNVIWDPHHKQRQLVELRQIIGTRSEM